jgi:hypothetical protein
MAKNLVQKRRIASLFFLLAHDGQLAFSLRDAYRQVNAPAAKGAARVTRTPPGGEPK